VSRYLLSTSLGLAQIAQCQSTKDVAGSDGIATKVTAMVLKLRSTGFERTTSLEAKPVLQEGLASISDPLLRENIASVLVTIGQKDEVYWSVLAERAQEL
jgi:hypothetical protein